jgi:antitoxin MazE
MNNKKDKGVYSMTTKAQRWGNSIGVRIPSKLVDKFGIVNGTSVKILEKDDGILIKPVDEVPSLEELMSKITADNQHQEVDWGKEEGAEIW